MSRVLSVILKASLTTIFFYGIFAAIYFFAADRWDLLFAWMYFTINCGTALLLIAAIGIKDPGLLNERMKPGPGEQDRLYRPVATILTALTTVVAGFDVGRRHWWPTVPAGLQIVALVLVFVGLMIVAWAMFVNSFFSVAVRLQSDRGHALVTSGPYAYVRHPGYAGGVLYLIFTGIALGSWWATLPMMAMLAFTLRRAVLEDAMLREGLAGYRDYAHKVRFRLIPGLW